MNTEKQKYLFFYLRTGGGHLAPARSVAQYLSQQHGERIDPVLIDGLVESHPFARYIIEDGYRMLQAKAKWYYEFLYATNKFPPVGYFNVVAANYFIKPFIRKTITERRPSKIFVFHFLLITPVYQILKELELDIPVITVVTDPFTAHPLWFQRKDQQYVLFSERLREHCLSRKIPESSLKIFPFIIDEKFSQPLSPESAAAARSRLGVDAAKPLVLIIGGGDGIPHGRRILEHLLSASLPVQIAIVCGKNEELLQQATELKRRYPELVVYGFVDFVYELLNIADIVITKCGASTIMEILMMKKIPVIIDYLWEQELGNMEFVRDRRLGIFERNIAKLPEIIRTLSTKGEAYGMYRRNLDQLSMRNGTRDVGEYFLNV